MSAAAKTEPTGREEEWDLIIKPKAGLLDLRLKELHKYRDLLWLWVRREYVGAYKQTLLGPLWHFISPVFTTLTYLLIFGKIAKLDTDGIPQFLFYNAGYTIWTFFAGCFGAASGAFLNNAGIFGKVYFPRLIMPLASIVSTLIKFGIQFALFIVAFIFTVVYQGYQPNLGAALLLIPICLVLTAGIGFGFGIIVSSLTTKYRDLNVFVGFGLQLLMYGTPVVYTFSSLSPTFRQYLQWNPLVAPLEAFKYALFGQGDFSMNTLLYSATWMVVLIFSGLILFNKAERSFMDTV
jgi:lipopolysaccharide transport system permease protein